MEESETSGRRRLIGGANAVVIGVVAVVVAVLINAMFSQIFWRVDVTEHQMYTLSPVSEQAADELDEPVEVRAFISPNMPPPYHHLERQVEELLMEYEAASGGLVDYRIISSEHEEELEAEAADYGIEPVTIGQETETERAYRSVYKGVAFVSGDSIEVIDELQASGRPELDNFEYEFTRALLNLDRDEPQRVGIVTGQGGPADHRRYVEVMKPLFEDMYGRLLTVESVDLDDGFEAVEELSALIFINIDGFVGDEALGIIDRFIQRGGNVGWFQSGGVFDADEQRRMIEQLRAGQTDQVFAPTRQPLESDLIDYFGAMGIDFGSDAVIDREQALAHGPVPTEQGVVHVSHPAMFPITDIAHELPFMRHFSTLVIPLPATVTIDEQAVPDGVDAYEVMRTDESSVRLPGPPARPIYDEMIAPMTGEQQGSFPIAAALQGPLPRFIDTGEDVDGERAEEARILVIGSGEFMSELAEVGYQGELVALGLQLFVNGVEWLAQERELAEIRGKSMPALVADVPSDARRSMQIINIAIVPGLFASIGLLMLIRRRRRKEALMEVHHHSRVEESAQD